MEECGLLLAMAFLLSLMGNQFASKICAEPRMSTVYFTHPKLFQEHYRRLLL